MTLLKFVEEKIFRNSIHLCQPDKRRDSLLSVLSLGRHSAHVGPEKRGDHNGANDDLAIYSLQGNLQGLACAYYILISIPSPDLPTVLAAKPLLFIRHSRAFFLA